MEWSNGIVAQTRFYLSCLLQQVLNCGSDIRNVWSYYRRIWCSLFCGIQNAVRIEWICFQQKWMFFYDFVKELALFFVELIRSAAPIKLLLVPADWSLGMAEWIGNWDMLSLAIIGAAWVGNWLTVHKPVALSWALTSFGRYKSRETIFLWKFCIQTKSFRI